MKQIIFSTVLFIACVDAALAGDPSFSQSYNNPVYMNPALTGANSGLRVNMSDMRQWTRVPRDINTTSFSADLKEDCSKVGLGITALHDDRGEGFLTTDQMGLTASWGTPVIAKKLDFAFGMGANFVQKTLDWSKLEFSDQFDPLLGKVTSTNAQPQNQGKGFLDINTGMSVKFTTDLGNGFSMLNNIGLAVHHLNRPDEGFIGVSRLPALYTLHAGSVIPIGKRWRDKGEFLFPYFVYNWQELFNQSYYLQREIITGFYVFKNSFMYGVIYRDGYLPFYNGNSNQLGLSAGFQLPFRNTSHAFQVTYSYMFPLDGVSYSALGTHEISLIIMFDRVNAFCHGNGDGSSGKGANKCFNDKRSGFIPQL